MQDLLAKIRPDGEELRVTVERIGREKEEVQGDVEEEARERNRLAEELLQLPQTREERLLATQEASPLEAHRGGRAHRGFPTLGSFFTLRLSGQEPSIIEDALPEVSSLRRLSLKSCIVEQQGKLARERFLVLHLEPDQQHRQAGARERQDSATSLDRESQGVSLDPSLLTENQQLKVNLDSSRRERRMLQGWIHGGQQELG